jgi:hypothetical protein
MFWNFLEEKFQNSILSGINIALTSYFCTVVMLMLTVGNYEQKTPTYGVVSGMM